MKSASNFITCLLFGLILITPVTLTLSGKELTKPLEENRTREKFPDLTTCELFSVDECHKKLDTWFNDNYGPRDLFIKLKTQIDYSVFSTSDKVHIGEDNWLFYRSTMDVEKVASERIPQTDFDRLLAEFDALNQYLSTKNIQLIVLPIPLKDVIYPEYLPGSSPNLPHNSRYQQLRDWLAGHDSILTIDAYDHLVNRKNEARAFHKTDFHWNDPSGFLYAERLVNTLWSLQSGEATVLWDKDLSIKEESYSGGQANFLPLLAAPREQGLFLDVNWQRTKGKHIYNTEKALWDYTYDGTGEERGRLDGAVIMGDSFFDALHRSGIDKYFSTVHRTKVNPEAFDQVYTNIPDGTRYFIFEFIEVSLFSFSVYGLSVPDRDQVSTARPFSSN